MNREEIIEKLRKIYAEHFDFGFDVDDITEETDWERDLNYDSIDQISFVMSVEGEFDICIPDEEISKMGRRVGNFVKYLEKELNR